MRLSEARATRDRLDRNARINRILGGVLTFGQVVVGGLLTSSFITDKLSATLAGLAGVAVLAAQLIRRQFDFQGSVVAADQKSSILSSAIRKAEDDLAEIREVAPDAQALPSDFPSVQDVTDQLTTALNQVDSLEMHSAPN